MKHLRLAPILLLTLFVVGCATDPASRVAQARSTLSQAQDSIVALNAAGVVSDEQLVALDNSVQAARMAIKVAESQPTDTPAFDRYLDLAESILEQLIQIQETSNGTRSDIGWDQGRPGYYRLPAGAGRTWQAGWKVHTRAA